MFAESCTLFAIWCRKAEALQGFLTVPHPAVIRLLLVDERVVTRNLLAHRTFVAYEAVAVRV